MIKYPEDSLAIVCINKHQKELVEEEFARLRDTDEEVKNYIDKWDENPLERFIVNNLESIQGDERDNIIVSTVFGKQDGTRNVRQNFGPIGGIYGHKG